LLFRKSKQITQHCFLVFRLTIAACLDIDNLLAQKVEHKTTLIVVTHDVRGARTVGDRIVVLDRGNCLSATVLAFAVLREYDLAGYQGLDLC